MKKIILLSAFMTFGISQITFSQLDYGIKGGINYNSGPIKNISEAIFEGTKSRAGFHAGVWLRFKIPGIGYYLRPELIFTSLNNRLTYLPMDGSKKATDFKFNKIDIPILFGKKFLGIANTYIGPSFQYVLDADFSISEINSVKADGFTVGVQAGAGVELGRFGIDIRWERALSLIESTLVKSATNINFDTRVSQVIVSLSIRL